MQSLALPLPLFSSLSKVKQIPAKLILGFSLALLFFVLGFYVFQVGNLTAISFSIKNLEIEIGKTSQANAELKASLPSQLSLFSLEEKIAQLDFVKVSSVKYIPIPSHYLVKKEN